MPRARTSLAALAAPRTTRATLHPAATPVSVAHQHLPALCHAALLAVAPSSSVALAANSVLHLPALRLSAFLVAPSSSITLPTHAVLHLPALRLPASLVPLTSVALPAAPFPLWRGQSGP